MQLGAPVGPLLKQLKAGQDLVLDDGRVISAAACAGRTVPGRKVVILGDTYDPSAIAPLAENCHVLIHESTFDASCKEMALEKGHSTSGTLFANILALSFHKKWRHSLHKRLTQRN